MNISKTYRVRRRGRRTSLLAVVLLIAVMLGCASQPKPYVVLYAFSEEGRLLGEQMTATRRVEHLGRTVTVGNLSGKMVVLAEAGIGMSNAAMTTQKMIDEYNPVAVIMTGIAGAIDTSVSIGDIVVCREWMQHDYGYIGGEGFEPDDVPAYMPHADSVVKVDAFTVDSTMFAVARSLETAMVALDSVGTRRPRVIVGGVGVSGNSFIDSEEKRLWLNGEFDAVITDMESAAVALVCAVNGIPFIVFRSASDLAGGSGSETAGAELEEFFQIAADNSSKVVAGYLGEL
ncbi:MAG: 5'-methylthioadenosine/S-adenosylhomocysteine nucleosidase [Candidatus Zixiibacteriota bacterium]|nr:MAG: 5'-methylthioadenosine/S-adenosylhomocysteine nucleosidase [candidate division Zixibacteria bacterium]